MKPYILFAFLNLLSSLLSAQTDTCIRNLKNAAADYEQSYYDQAITVLKNTLKECDLSKQDQIQANKLLILCYIAIDNLEEANHAAVTIMKIDPQYMPDKFKDDPRLSSLFDKFKPEPTFSAGISGGINFPMIDVLNTYSVVHADDKPGLANYDSRASFQIQAEIQKRAFKNLWVELGLQFRNTEYNHTLDSIQGYTIDYSENLNYYDIPLSLKFYLLSGALQPYLQAGADFSFLGRALSITTRSDQKDLVDRTALRDNFQVGYLGSAGVSYTINAFRLSGNIRYTYFPDLVNKNGTRYSDDINLYKYYYIDDDFKMNNIQMNIGASYILSYRIKTRSF